jgi:hypothetical protein
VARKTVRTKTSQGKDLASPSATLAWIKAEYAFHTFAYRDPRTPQSSAPALPVVSPTAILLGIASTLFNLGLAHEARAFLDQAHVCQVLIVPPLGAIFFRAFHQLRRYETDQNKGKKENFKPNPRVGLTDINQGIREHAIFEGFLRIFAGVPPELSDSACLALRNRNHVGTHDSLCSLVGEVEPCSAPTGIVFLSPEQWQNKPPDQSGVSVVTLARFRGPLQPTVDKRWWMAGGPETELVPFLIPGRFTGTSRGKIFRRTGVLD